MADWKYDGFISYSTRADSVLADRIQLGLERLAKPWNRRKALKIFQDVDDLAASSDLSRSLRGELEASNTLVFLASPESAASPWCGDELAYWIAERPPEQLVVVLTDGTLVFDKDASPPIDFERSTAAPPAFAALSSVPLYVDMRDIGETDDLDHRTNPEFRARLTKVAAALHSNKSGQAIEPRDIDSLDLREHRRTKRIRNGAIAALTILTVGAVIASIFAVLNAREANSQRAEAERQAANALARLAVATAEDDAARALDDAATAYSIAQSDTTGVALQQLLWSTRPLVWTVDVGEPVAHAVPLGDDAFVGTATGRVAAVGRDGSVEPVVDGATAVTALTAADGLVAIGWADGRVVLLDAPTRSLLLDAQVGAEVTAVAPYPAGDGALVALTATATYVVDPTGARPVSEGDDTPRRLHVDGHVATFADGFAITIDLTTGRRIGVGTGGNRAVFHDAAAGVGMVVDDRTPEVSVGPAWSGEGEPPADADPSWGFERQQEPSDDVVLSADGRRVAALSGAVLELWSRPVVEGRGQRELVVSGVAGVGDDDRRVEVDASQPVAVTVGGTVVQRWEAGRDVAAAAGPAVGAMATYIAVGVTNDEVLWDDIDRGPSRLDLATGVRSAVPTDERDGVYAELTGAEPDDQVRESPDGTLTARIANGRITLRTVPDGDVWLRIDPAADTGYLVFSPDGRYLVLAARGGGLEYWPLRLEDLCPELDRRVRPGTAALAGCGAE